MSAAQEAASMPERISSPARSRSREDLSIRQLEFSAFAAQLQVCDGAVHRVVLLRTKTSPEPDSRVLRFRLHLESLGLAAGTINQRLAAVRRLAYEAADSGLLSPELAAGIRRVKGVKQLGCRAGNWLNQGEASARWMS